MSRSIAPSALALLSLAAACAAEDVTTETTPKEESKEYELQPAQLAPELDEAGNPIPGTLVLDTSEGRMDITDLVPEKPREFGSRDEFHEWAQKALNARIVEHEGGYGTSIDYTAGAALLRNAETGEYDLVEDPVEMIIGGREGRIIIAGESHCASRHAACAQEMGLEKPKERALVSGITTASGPAGRMGVLAMSWHSFPKAFVPFITEVGASTTQWNAPGGVRVTWVTCSTNIYKTCVVVLGSNVLSASFAARRGGGTIRTRSSTVANWPSMIVARFDADVWPFTGTDNVCARHTGFAAGDFVAALTGSAAGIPANNCP